MKLCVALSLLISVASAQSPVYGQCGGASWTGATTCASGSTCVYSNAYYSQCIPGAATTTSKTTTASTGTPTGLKLRVLPLGDSITYGTDSSDGNGYRSTLHNLLSQGGNTVDFIGSVKAGTMADNDNEGHPGYTIAQIANTSTFAQALPARPNLVFLMAGTNDVYGGSFGTAPNRLETLINSIFSAVPSTVLVVATLTPLPSGQTQVNTYNQQVTTLVNSIASSGKHIVLVSMSSLTASDLSSDQIHPTDGGYVKMANAWYPGFQKAAAAGWIVPPS